eukprot:COSAG01_NODE_44077_length_422_cov_13.674923_1_plen_68_part_10
MKNQNVRAHLPRHRLSPGLIGIRYNRWRWYEWYLRVVLVVYVDCHSTLQSIVILQRALCFLGGRATVH